MHAGAYRHTKGCMMPGGRPSKLTPELQAKMAELFLGGNFAETVCDYVGLNKVTFYNWMKRGEQDEQFGVETPYVEFFNVIKTAMAQVEVETIAALREGPLNWQAKAWFLERRYPDKWGAKQKHLHAGMKDGAIEQSQTTEIPESKRLELISKLLESASVRPKQISDESLVEIPEDATVE
jgi:transposase